MRTAPCLTATTKSFADDLNSASHVHLERTAAQSTGVEGGCCIFLHCTLAPPASCTSARVPAAVRGTDVARAGTEVRKPESLCQMFVAARVPRRASLNLAFSTAQRPNEWARVWVTKGIA